MREFVQERKYISDVEGPYSLNDNALEVSSLLIPNGHEFFSQLSAYDDFIVNIEKKSNYNSGCTLGLLLPFFKAFGATNNLLETISSRNVKLMHGTNDTLQFLNKKMKCYLISTSYEQHIRAFCKAAHFPFDNTVCTKLDLDNERFELNGIESDWLKKRAEEIASLPKLKIPINAKSRDELPDDVLVSVERLDQIFWDEMENEYLKAFELLGSVETIGGPKKEQAIIERASDFGNISYTGDSITDREALSRVKREGGLSVSINGDMYAVNEAEIGCMIENTLVTTILVDAFYNSGREGALDLVDNWNLSGLKKAKEQTLVYPKLISQLLTLYPKKLPEVVILTDENRKEFGKKSTYFGSKLREGKVHGRN